MNKKKGNPPVELLRSMAFDWKCRRSPSIPRHAMPRPQYEDNTPAGLESCVYDFMRMRGENCTRGHVGLTLSICSSTYHLINMKASPRVQADQLRFASGGILPLYAESFKHFIRQYCQHNQISIEKAFTTQDRHTERGTLFHTKPSTK